VQALPQAAFFLLLEAAVGGAITLLWVHLRGEVTRGFILFTGAGYLVCGALAIWLRSAFPAVVAPDNEAVSRLWLQAERLSTVAFVLLLAAFLLVVRTPAWKRATNLVGTFVPLLGLVSLWSAALASANAQLFGFGVPLAVLAGAMALGSALTGLSLGHWYLVSPTISVRPLIRVTFLCIGALTVQLLLLPLELFTPGAPQEGLQALFSDDLVFFGVRVVFGLLVPLVSAVMTWRTARIRSLDSATGLLYIVAALVLAGEITARTLQFQLNLTT
jgi:hypothetical protein